MNKKNSYIPEELINDKGMPYNPKITKAVKDPLSSLFISYFLSIKAVDWVGKGRQQIEEETGLSKKSQISTTKHLIKHGILQTKRKPVQVIDKEGQTVLKNLTHYKFDWQLLQELIESKQGITSRYQVQNLQGQSETERSNSEHTESKPTLVISKNICSTEPQAITNKTEVLIAIPFQKSKYFDKKVLKDRFSKSLFEPERKADPSYYISSVHAWTLGKDMLKTDEQWYKVIKSFIKSDYQDMRVVEDKSNMSTEKRLELLRNKRFA